MQEHYDKIWICILYCPTIKFNIKLKGVVSGFSIKLLLYCVTIRPPKNVCVFQVSRPYLGFCPNPKHFIVNSEEITVKNAEKSGKL